VYGLGSDEVLTRKKWYPSGPPQNIFYHTNALGSVTAVTSDTGEVLERYKYDAYGQVTFLNPSNNAPISSSTVFNNILFTGRYYDTETKLYYYRARTYHPYMGRFLQRDPLGEAASINLYNYVFNNPVNATDPSGLYGGKDSWFGREMLNSLTMIDDYMRERSAREQQYDYESDQAMRRFRGNRDLTGEYDARIAADQKEQAEEQRKRREAKRIERARKKLAEKIASANNNQAPTAQAAPNLTVGSGSATSTSQNQLMTTNACSCSQAGTVTVSIITEIRPGFRSITKGCVNEVKAV